MRRAALLALAGLAACAPARFAMRDAEAARAVRRVAVLPFFLANELSVERETPGLFGERAAWSRRFARLAERKLKDRFEVVSGEPVFAALKAAGAPLEPDAEKRAGFTFQQAVAAGRSLKADAVLIGAASVADAEAFRALFADAAVVRLVDARTGKVLWGASATRKGLQGDPVSKIVGRLKKELR